MSKLVIVESPAKAKTIKKYLGPGYEVLASMGHVRDLPSSQLGIDVKNNYKPQYISIAGKEKLIRSLKTAAENKEQIFLATDPDREGEAISWHLAKLLKLDPDAPSRVTFGEITEKGVRDGMAKPRPIDKDLFDAQQARRVLDRLVGYKLSPFLWKKVKRGLSAGRVQSVALRLIVDREKAIEAFKPEEYWNIDALLSAGGAKDKKFEAHFYGAKEGQRMKLENKQQTDDVLAHLKGAAYKVAKLSQENKKRSPAPPFTTSTLQQEASRRLGFTASRTMRAAQTLYEGVDMPGLGTTGLITYMRTDSLRVSDDAVRDAKQYIEGAFGHKYVYGKKRHYKSKNQSAVQDAHEAVRPTIPTLTPAEVEKAMSGDVAKLYRLIWSRFIASQMANADVLSVAADIEAGDYLFRATGYTMLFDGFTALYEEEKDEKEKKETALPPLSEGQALKLHKLGGEQKFTQPPSRYTEATLIRELEENGIGRPSTYAPIISTVLDRGYVQREQKRLAPTSLGRVVTDLMEAQFPRIVDVKFSAGMEKQLDEIEEGRKPWIAVIDDFYGDFEKRLKAAETSMEGQRMEVPEEETDEICEKCGRNMVIKTGRYGKFLACPGFPECKNTRRLVKDTGGKCPKCGSRMLQRRSKKGRIYYSCENTECDFMTWDEPTSEPCPQCGKLLFKKGGRNSMLYCADPACGYKKPLKNS